MSDTAEKVRENRLRRMAARQGFQLAKSRRRDDRALDYGRYWLYDAHTGDMVWIPGTVAVNHYSADLDDVEDFLTSDERG